jgi:hypothetical protein
MDLFEQAMLQLALEKGVLADRPAVAGSTLCTYCASRRGDTAAVHHLASTGEGVNHPGRTETARARSCLELETASYRPPTAPGATRQWCGGRSRAPPKSHSSVAEAC